MQIKDETMHKVLNYLYTQPFGQVAGIIKEITSQINAQTTKPISEDTGISKEVPNNE